MAAGQKELKPVVMEGMRLIFRNFKGEESEFNPPGHMNFGVILPEDVAEAMARDGWNVKRLKPSEEEKEEGIEQGPPWLSVKVRFDNRPPKILMITSRGPTQMTEETVSQLDFVDIATDENGNPKVDLIVNPFPWKNQRGESGISAYLQSMYVTIEEDPLTLKYADLGTPQ